MNSANFMYGMNPYMANNMNCDIPYAADPLYGAKLAYSYVPFQRGGAMYTECEALKHGTVFTALIKPLNVYGLEFCTHNDKEDCD